MILNDEVEKKGVPVDTLSEGDIDDEDLGFSFRKCKVEGEDRATGETYVTPGLALDSGLYCSQIGL